MSTNTTNDTLIKLRAAADILGGAVFFANAEGFDPEYPENGDLLPTGMYIRLEGSDGSMAYVSAYEIDNLIKNLDAITRTKASQSDLTALQETVNAKATKTELELLKSQLDNTVSKADIKDITDSIANKAEQSDLSIVVSRLDEKASKTSVDTLTETVATKADADDVTALENTISTKADADDVTALENAIKALEEVVGTLTDTDNVSSINAQIEYLNTELNKRLVASDLNPINTSLTDLTNRTSGYDSRLETIETNLSKKANTTYVQGQVSELSSTIANIISTVENKADKSSVSNKADKDDVTTLTSNLAANIKAVSDLATTVTGNYNELNTELEGKADKASTESQLNAINSTLVSKADKSTFNETIDRITNQLNAISSNTTSKYSDLMGDIDELECEFNNVVAEVRASINTQNKNITQQDTKIKTLQTASDSYKEQLKQKWIRVLTTTEYKNLRNPVEGASYNDRYKYPNVVYMVVDFNKPKALYIGDILVAKAEQGGSIGFAYTFPMVF